MQEHWLYAPTLCCGHPKSHLYVRGIMHSQWSSSLPSLNQVPSTYYFTWTWVECQVENFFFFFFLFVQLWWDLNLRSFDWQSSVLTTWPHTHVHTHTHANIHIYSLVLSTDPKLNGDERIASNGVVPQPPSLRTQTFPEWCLCPETLPRGCTACWESGRTMRWANH